MFDWFMNDGFSELVILDHEMLVFDTLEYFDFDYLNDKIQDVLDIVSIVTYILGEYNL